MRGPVHEAFAEQFSSDPLPTEVVSKEPPEAIDEVPPNFKPEGENIQWISGYWGWDVESEGFVWVTGVWRNVPPDQQWIPGYWSKVDNGWQWISGFWTAAKSDDLVYLPTPPESIENGPSSAAPGENYFWVPGTWQLNQDQYQWQAGYWAQAQDNWVWVPNRYIWTPSGCIYREGYWDHELETRGTIFCPMTFQTGYHQQFQPRYVVEVGPLWLANLFVVPGFNHYCFGNYHGYGGNRTIYPWVNYYQRSHRYDPLYGYYAYQTRNANLIRQIARVERQILGDPALRAQLTVAEQLRAYSQLTGPQASWALRAIPLNKLAANRDADFNTPFQFTSFEQKLNPGENANKRSPQQLATQRRKLEQPENNQDKQRAQPTAPNQKANGNDAKDGKAPKDGKDINSGSGNVKRIKLRDSSKTDPADRVTDANRSTAPGNSQNKSQIRSDKQGDPNDPSTKKNATPRSDNKRDINPPNNSSKVKPNPLNTDDRKQGTQAPNRDPNDALKNKPNDGARSKANDSKSPFNPLDKLYQGLDEKRSDADDARQLRDMMRRNVSPRGDAKSGNTADPNVGRPRAPAIGSRAPGSAKPDGGAKPPGNVKPDGGAKRSEAKPFEQPRLEQPRLEQPRSNANLRGPAEAGKNSNTKGPKEPNKPAKQKNGKDKD
jgi:hypothetical protein